MTQSPRMLRSTAARLRRDFDRSFSAAPVLEKAQSENLLAIRIGGDTYAIRATEIAGLYAGHRVVPLPTDVPALLGLTSIRGQLTPVYDLATLLGYASSATGRWLVLARARHTAALAFEMFEAQFGAPPEHVIADSNPQTRAHQRGAVRHDGQVRPILSLPSVLADIERRVETMDRPMKER